MEKISSVFYLLGLERTRKNRGNDKMRVKVVKVRIVNILIFSVNNLMNKDSDKISLMLDFLSKNCRDERVRSLLGQGKDLFYQIPCEELKKKSLLQYIDAQGSKMVRQKEELIDLGKGSFSSPRKKSGLVPKGGEGSPKSRLEMRFFFRRFLESRNRRGGDSMKAGV